MRLLAAAISVLVLLGHVAVMRLAPGAWWGLVPAFRLFNPNISPLGSLLMHGGWLAGANAMIWLASRPDRPSADRFQLAAGGWIFIFLALFRVAYAYSYALEN